LTVATRIQDAHQPLDLALAVIPSLPRSVLSRLVARAIERLDEIDGDADAEQTGDEAEPDFAKPPEGYHGPGCAISDPDAGIEDGAEGPTEDWQDDRPIADPQAYHEHIARVRRHRCYRPRRDRYDRYGWQLYTEPTTPTKRQLLRRKRGVPRRPRA
jgi:hypothetical protein